MLVLGGMSNCWGLWWLFFIAICDVLTLYDLYVIVINDGVYVVDKLNVLRPIINAHENNVNRLLRRMNKRMGLVEKEGIYIVVGEMVGGGKCYCIIYIYIYTHILYIYIYIYIGLSVWRYINTLWYRLHLCRGVRPPRYRVSWIWP